MNKRIKKIFKSDNIEYLKNIKEELKNNPTFSKIYYDMGELYKYISEYNRAYLCYEQALYLCKDEEDKLYINNKMNNLKKNYNIEVKPLSFIILTYNNLEYTQNCVNSIRENVNKSTYEIIVVDNNSTDGTSEWLREQQDIRCIFNEDNKGFPKGCNQGIEIASKNNDIFLLNNDTIIKPNSIFNMRMGLYSSEEIGATGAVSNNVPYFQTVDLSADTMEEYEHNILVNNITDENSYEERTKLIGFAMLIKRNVLDKVGLLDERFTPGNYEDDDISVRIIAEGYKLLLCKDSFIYHYGGMSFRDNLEQYYNLLCRNNIKFIEKWDFKSSRAMMLYRYDKELVEESDKNILEIDCGIGSNLVYIRNKLHNANYFGIEENESLHFLLKNLGIKCIDTYKNDIYKNYFDCIIVNNYEILEDNEFISEIHKYLNIESGRLIVNLDAYYLDVEYFDISDIKHIQNKLLKNKLELKNIYKVNDGDKIYSVNMSFEYITRENVEQKIIEYLKEGKLTFVEGYIKRIISYNVLDDYDFIEQKYSSLIKSLESIKFSLRRLEFKGEAINEEFYRIIEENKISDIAINQLIEDNIIDKSINLNTIMMNDDMVQEKTILSCGKKNNISAEQKICFISCVNNEQYYNECLYYINKLNIPQGYTIETIAINDASSIAEGYNRAMELTDAKYKIYLHQDTFILDENILYKIIEIFNDSSIGMIGAVGSPIIDSEGIWWNCDELYGNYYDNVQGKMKRHKLLAETNDKCIDLNIIDGFIMITQYDIRWREDIFDGWHYYDYSQSMEFKRAGYKVVTPNIDTTWVMHDCGLVNVESQEEYYRYNKIFKVEYKK